MKRSLSLLSMVLTLVLFNAADRLEAAPPSLFKTLRGAKAVPSTKKTKRAQVMTLDTKYLVRRGTDADSTIRLNLFPNVSVEGLVEATRVDGPDQFVTWGRITWTQNDSFLFVVRDKAIAGTISFGDRQFRVMTVPGGKANQVVVSELAPPEKEDCGCSPENVVVSPAAKPVATSDDGSTIDVLVAYTPKARTSVGGTSAMQALIQLAVEEANAAYQASQVVHRLRLVHSRETTYTESAGFSSALNALTSTNDGKMDELHSLRNQYGADLVSLIIDDSSSCGIAWLMANESPSFASSGFSVVHYDCATGYYSFAHELGHNMGLAHDRANAGSAVRPYAYGWRWNGTGGQYRSIMAYAPGTRVQRFSNPNVLYAGAATGVANSEENYRALNDTRNTVANFRQSTVGANPTITSPPTAYATEGSSFTYQITATGSPTSFGATGLPSGLNVSSSTGLISGTPSQTGQFSVLLSATNGSGTGTLSMTLTVSQNNCPARVAVEEFRKKWAIPVPLDLFTSTLPTLRKLRDELLLPHPEGRKLVEQYYEHGTQLVPMLAADPLLIAQATPLLLDILPNIEAGIKTDGTFRLSSTQYQRVVDLLTEVESEASLEAGKWVGDVREMFERAARKERKGVVIELSTMLQTK